MELALYNDGNQPIQFNSGNMAALTATIFKVIIILRLYIIKLG